MKQKKKVNFWKLLFQRRKFNSYYELYNKLAIVEPEDGKYVIRSIVRTFVQTTLIFCIIGGAAWLWYYIKPHSHAITFIKIGTPIAIVVLLLLGYIGRKMLIDFKAYAKHIKTLTEGGGIYDGMYDMLDLVD